MHGAIEHKQVHPLVATVAGTVSRWGMLRRGDAVLVAVSGGPDSVALLHVLIELSADLGLRLGVAHLNHSLRGRASDSDAAFVSTLAQKLNITCHTFKKDIQKLREKEGGNLEERSRRARYAFFEKTAAANGYRKIAIGHHADDSAELVLMNLLRGSGPGGIAGIAPVRGRSIVRPLIDVRRRDIIAYLQAGHISFVQDASNRDPGFLRNRIRNKLIPELCRNVNPRLPETLVRTAAIVREEEAWLQKIVAGMLDAATVESDGGQVILSAAYLSGLPVAALRRVLRTALERLKGDLRGITFAHVSGVADLLLKKHAGRERHLPGRILARRRKLELVITRENRPLRETSPGRPPEKSVGFRYDIAPPAGRTSTVLIEETGQKLLLSVLDRDEMPGVASAGQNCGFFDMEKLAFPLMLRRYQAGDRFTPLGLNGSQKVSKFFIDHKVAHRLRQTCPILLNRGRIVWVVGHRIDDHFKVGAATRRILKMELLLA